MRNVVVRTLRTGKWGWQATLDHHEQGDPIGYGTSEPEAVYELFCIIEQIEADDQDRYEHEMGTGA